MGVFEIDPAILFRVCCTIIGSESLTTVFGMGTGVSFRIWSPGNTATGRFKTSRGEFCCGVDALPSCVTCEALLLANHNHSLSEFPSFWPYQPLIRELFVT